MDIQVVLSESAVLLRISKVISQSSDVFGIAPNIFKAPKISLAELCIHFILVGRDKEKLYIVPVELQNRSEEFQKELREQNP